MQWCNDTHTEGSSSHASAKWFEGVGKEKPVSRAITTVDTRVGKAAFLANGQRVNIGTQGNRRPARTAP